MVNLLLKKQNIFINLVQRKCTAFIKSTVVYSNVLGLHIHSPLTHSLTQSNFQFCKLHSQLSDLHRLPFLSVIPYFYYTFSICLIHKHLPFMLQLPIILSRIICCVGVQLRSNTLYYTAQVCSRLYYLGLCKCTLRCSDDETT